MGFQTTVQIYPAPGQEGDFASTNPTASLIAPEGGYVAASGGATIGRFAWTSGSTVSNAGSGKPKGIIHRESQALITTFLAEGSYVIPQGLPVTIHNQGDFWVKTLTNATVGQKVFASLTTGQVKTDAAGATVSGYIETDWSVASAASANEIIIVTKWGV